jgi:acyl-coenzyme A synthetase/AMP-(fatty) acid ligase
MPPPRDHSSLSSCLRRNSDLSDHVLAAPERTVRLSELLGRSYLADTREGLAGRSVLLRTKSQLAAAVSLIELDGVVRRIVLCPPDLAVEHLAYVIQTAAVDCCISDSPEADVSLSGLPCHRVSFADPVPIDHDRESRESTEWVLLTSGTTGPPKLVVHSLATLTGATNAPVQPSDRPVWSTFYDIRRYGGLQIFLRAVLTGATLVLSDAEESATDFLRRAAADGITHLSGTPSHWRRALMSPVADVIAPRYVRLSGEIADGAILSQLRSSYPEAKVVHAFASTEAGVAFEVEDGLPGIPPAVFERRGPVELKIEGDSLRIRSNRVADRYLGDSGKPLKSADGFVDTGDMVEHRGDRYYFSGRRDGVINVGGAKVHPEEVEAVINRHPDVRMSMVRARKSPITGAVIVADVVLWEEDQVESKPAGNLQRDILLLCRNALAAHKVPASIKVVSSLPVAQSGKLLRHHA